MKGKRKSEGVRLAALEKRLEELERLLEGATLEPVDGAPEGMPEELRESPLARGFGRFRQKARAYEEERGRR